jgi:hypothetical protein
VTRTLLRVRVTSLEEVPQFVVFSEAEGFFGDSWTVQCEIIQQNLLGGQPQDEDPVGKVDPTLFTKTLANDLFVCQIYVDDIIFGSTNESTCKEFSRTMTQKIEMSMMGELKYFLGFQVKQLHEGTFISQTKYIQDILTKFGMKDAKPIKTPMGTNGHLDLDTRGKSVDQKVYRSMIGSLLYLCASRPDIMLSVCMCARFQTDPKEVHLRAVKRILRYLVYTPKFGLWYPRGSTFDLIGYFDAD